MDGFNTTPSGNYTAGPMPQKKGNGGTFKILIIVVVALIVVWGLFKVFSGGNEGVDNGNYVLKSADEGEVVSSFPSEFLIEPEATVKGSYELKYKDNKGTLPTVEYTSAKPLDENIEAFRKILTDNGWTVTKEATSLETPTTNFYAIKGGNDVNITLTSIDGGAVTVHIAYIERVPVTE